MLCTNWEKTDFLKSMLLTETGDVTLVFHKVQDKWKEQIPKTRFPGVIMSFVIEVVTWEPSVKFLMTNDI